MDDPARDDPAREAVLGSLVRDSGAIPESIEIVRQRRVGDQVTALARWTEARTGRSRRAAVDVAMTDGAWRERGGWEFQRHPRFGSSRVTGSPKWHAE